MKQLIIENESPIARSGKNGMAAKATISGSADMYGACSIETFANASPLSLTHEDAQGWLDCITQFTPANFWYKDGNVQVWLYEETNDNYQDTYGSDAVCAFYHSGHGVMDSNGVYQAPMGGKWDNRDRLFSSNMRLGNETVRYLFWSTCFSLRVFSPHDPIRTWHPVNQGFRMLFGYETTSVDNANYGKFFWEEWKKGKPFSTAWLDASWRISHNQVPSVMATGATAAEAQARLHNEKQFVNTAGSRAFYNWRWYNAERGVETAPKLKAITSEIIAPQLVVVDKTKNEEREVAKIANKLGLTKKAADSILYDRSGMAFIKERNKKATLTKDGDLNIELGKFNYDNTDRIKQDEAVNIAKGVMDECGFGKKADLQLDQVIYGYSCSGTSKGSGKIGEPYINETIVQFRQIIDGLPAVNAGNGLVRVSIDNDGNVVRVANSSKKIADAKSGVKTTAAPPADKKSTAKAKTREFNLADVQDVEEEFRQKLNKIVGGSNGVEFKSMRKSSETEPEGTEIMDEKVGYDLSGGLGNLVAHREYEVDLGGGYKKRYKIRVPLHT